MPSVFLLLLAALNIFIGIFNLLPLLPLDGGHIAIAWYEQVRVLAAARLPAGPTRAGSTTYKLMPLTYVVILIFGGVLAAHCSPPTSSTRSRLVRR